MSETRPLSAANEADTFVRGDIVVHTEALQDDHWVAHAFRRSDGTQLLSAEVTWDDREIPTMSVTGEPGESFELQTRGPDNALEFRQWPLYVYAAVMVRYPPRDRSDTAFTGGDKNGCDTGRFHGAMSCGSSASAVGACCDAHDDCYALFGCTALTSWPQNLLGIINACTMCNAIVVACTLTTTQSDSRCCGKTGADACNQPQNGSGTWCNGSPCGGGPPPPPPPGDYCGDLSCNNGETSCSCPVDCSGTCCGNAICEVGESAGCSCVFDCPNCGEVGGFDNFGNCFGYCEDCHSDGQCTSLH